MFKSTLIGRQVALLRLCDRKGNIHFWLWNGRLAL